MESEQRLFVSDRIFVDGNFYNGGIVVNNEGKIGEVLKSQYEVDKWIDGNVHVAVSYYKKSFRKNNRN